MPTPKVVNKLPIFDIEGVARVVNQFFLFKIVPLCSIVFRPFNLRARQSLYRTFGLFGLLSSTRLDRKYYSRSIRNT